MLMRLYQGDCYEIMRDIPSNTVDLVVMDPPYEIGTAGGGLYTSKRRRYVNDLVAMQDGFSDAILDEICRVLKKINLYVFCSLKQMPGLLTYFVQRRGCNWNLLTWHKTNPVPACNNKYLSDTEYICFFRESGIKISGSYETKKTYFVTPHNKTDKDKYNHPTIKPENIIRVLVGNSSKPGDMVLDPFMGSGTTGVICKELQRDFIGIEIDPKHFATASHRISATKEVEIEQILALDIECECQLDLFTGLKL